MSRICARKRVVLSLAIGLLCSAVTSAQAPDKDAIDQAKRRSEVAAQKVEAQVREALQDAQRILLTDPGRAARTLREALAAIENDTNLPEARRNSLQRMLKDRLRDAEATKAQAVDAAIEKHEKKFVVIGRRADEARQSIQQADITRTLTTINSLQNAGKVEEANRLASDLARRYPDSLAAQTSGRSTATSNQIANDRQTRRDQDRRTAAVDRDILRSSTPPVGDIEFSKDFAEKSKARLKNNVQMTEKEKTIMQALNTPITVNFKDTRFEDAIEYLSTFTNQPIVLDKQSLDEAQISYETPVTVRYKGVAVRTLLRKILGEYGLTYVVRDETIQVVSAEKAKTMMVTRSYYLGDAIVGLGAGSFVFGPGIDQLQTIENANRIIEMIQTSVDPQSWQKNGGAGSIKFNFATLSLIVKQSAEIHSMLGSSLLR